MVQTHLFSSGPEAADLSFLDIRPGDWVVLKPNLVKEGKEQDLTDWACVITSPRVIRVVCEHVARRLAGQGRITICDAPQTDSRFALIAERLGLHALAREVEARHGVPVEVLDLRQEEWLNEGGIITDRRKLTGDPRGAIAFNLGPDSLFFRHPGEGRYYGADYDAGVVNSHHHGETHEYLICATPILADVFINLPKLKTHKKTGVTLSLKNLVGINADKNWLPHHTEGSPATGGDQFPDLSPRRRLEQWAVGLARGVALRGGSLGGRLAQRLRKAGTAAFGDGRTTVRSGNWHGNDTTWRMVLDLNRCLLYGNPDGTLRRDRPKRYYTVIDGLVGMEGDGPMQGDAIEAGVLIASTDPAAADLVAARFMGFDWRKLPVIREAFTLPTLPITTTTPDAIEVVRDTPAWRGSFAAFDAEPHLRFRPHHGWVGQIEASP